MATTATFKITTAGLGEILAGGKTAMTHLAVGTGQTTPTISDTALENEVARVAIVASYVLGMSLYLEAMLPAGVGTGTLWEAGLFNASTGGTCIGRGVFANGVVKDASDPMNVTVRIDIDYG